MLTSTPLLGHPSRSLLLQSCHLQLHQETSHPQFNSRRKFPFFLRSVLLQFQQSPRVCLHLLSSLQSLLHLESDMTTGLWSKLSRGRRFSVVTKPSLWQLIIQLKAEDASARAKVMSIRSGSWKDRNPARTLKRNNKRLAMQRLVMDYYTMGTGMFFESAISFFNEF